MQDDTRATDAAGLVERLREGTFPIGEPDPLYEEAAATIAAQAAEIERLRGALDNSVKAGRALSEALEPRT